MTAKPEREIDWTQTTWKGSRLQQHREFHALTFAHKLELIEHMSRMVAQFSPSKPAGASTLRESAPRFRPDKDST